MTDPPGISTHDVSPSSAEFFEAKYVASPSGDPWDFDHSRYEQQRYATLMDQLGTRRFERAFEPGCSVGALSRLLALRCVRVLSVDLSTTAIAEAQARARRAGVTNVEFRAGAFPDVLDAADGPYDLLCLVEVGYYFDAPSWGTALRRSLRATATPATVLVSHWTGSSSDHALGAAEVHDIAAEEFDAAGLEPAQERRHFDGFIAELWTWS